MSPQPNSLRSSHRPTQLLATCTTSVMSFATSTPRSGSTGGWVSLFRRHHFPRLPRVQENAAPSESGSTHVTFRHSFVELVTVADDRHGGPVGAEATLVPLQALPEILDPFTQTSCNCGSPRRHSRDSRACTFVFGTTDVDATLTRLTAAGVIAGGLNRVPRPVGTGSDAKQVSIGFVEVDSEPMLSRDGRIAIAEDGPADSSASTAGGEHPNGPELGTD